MCLLCEDGAEENAIELSGSGRREEEEDRSGRWTVGSECLE